MKKNAVKNFRLKLCLQQRELAKELGVSKVSISNWESGIRHPKISNIRSMKELAEKHNVKFNVEDFLK